SFGAGGDGYVPGEGVGAVLLKPLDSALRDGDQVYAVIKSSTVNHGGKTNGYTVPNPNAQGDLIGEALRKGGIDPRSLSYIETHGTGTSLGDPIEITGLMKAFGSSDEKQFCPIGSVKSNIGHLESAAGIAAVTKAVLQIRHKQLVPSIHAQPVNPHIDFESSPFYVQTELTEWKHAGAHPRRVGVSSFGAGGSNAHLILEEHAEERRTESVLHPMPFVLSAKDRDALLRYAERTIAFLDGEPELSLADIAYTSQVGRTPMDARLAVLASSVEELKEKLRQWVARRAVDDTSEWAEVFYGNVREARFGGADLVGGTAGKTFLENLLASGDLEKIARLWVLGVDIDWSLLHREGGPRRVSLATYPFARERHWIGQEPPVPRLLQKAVPDLEPRAEPRAAEEKGRTYYAVEWAGKPPAAELERRPPVGPILLLNGADGSSQALQEQMAQHSATAPVVVVKFGESFQELGPDGYVIDPEREEQFLELMQALESRSLLPAAVVHHAGTPCDLEDQQQVARSLNHGIYALFHLCQALMTARHHLPVRILSVYSGDGEAGSPLGAALGGFLKTLTLENPKYRAKVVEIPKGGLSLPEAAALIWDELCEPDWTSQEIRYQEPVNAASPTRLVTRLVLQAPMERTAASLPLRKNGVYLITGGLGHLGLIVAEYLAKNFQAELVLVGRSVPNARQEARLAALKLHGAEILCLQADVSKRSDLERAVGAAKARFGQIHGVFHAAGVNRDAFILKKSRMEMEAVLAPKVYGAINVDLATSGEPLDVFVLFSSVAGVMGNVGQCDYAYGNRFLDAFALTRETLRNAQTRSGRTRSIDWPFWEEGGMALSSDDLARLERGTGISPLPNGEGMQYLEDFLRSEAVQGIALYGIPSRIAAYLAPKDEKADRQVPAPAAGIDTAALFAKTEAYLKALIGEEINLSPDRIDSADRFESFGIDSVVINHFNARLERDLGSLPKTLLYEYETVRELATFLLQEAREALIARLGSADPGEQPAAPSTTIVEAADRHEMSPVTAADGLDEPIAIIGIHGRYPQSPTLGDYWENLKHGRDLTELVPASRWDYEAL
ncbi:MAG: hypothetical protein JWN02_1916, partial [Acidobacteria bacterium]|nr:hypothetical protein [Acidobacteriota bacterium]